MVFKEDNARFCKFLPSDGLEFERYIKSLLSNLGFSVVLTPASNDYGADIIAVRPNGNNRICIQAKFYGSPLGSAPVQQVVASLAKYDAQEAWVITNSTFTENARNLAIANRVKLIDNKMLNCMIDVAILLQEEDCSDFSVEQYSARSSLEVEPLIGADTDPLLNDAAQMVVLCKITSASSLQRRLKIGYARSLRLMRELELRGILGTDSSTGIRSVLVDSLDEIDLT